jgi:DNA uptake protein ComE-like DNA-binding protein
VTTAVAGGLSNQRIARLLRETAALLEVQQANPFRVRAYRRAADVVAAAKEPIVDLVEQAGPEALDALPGIGAGLASVIAELIATGRLAVLERLHGRSDPVSLLASIPGIGPVWADRIHHELGIGSLEDLELAAHDDRLEQMKGMGPKRLEGIRTALAGRLRRPRPPAESPDRQRPPVEDLLDVDREYRRKARAGELRTIAPLRFNPNREAWLPVLHTTRGARHFTALYSNTARAHRLGRSKDWVVIYNDGRVGEGQGTVVTEFSGPLQGRRVVRGREGECLQHYDVQPPPDPWAGTDGDGVI